MSKSQNLHLPPKVVLINTMLNNLIEEAVKKKKSIMKFLEKEPQLTLSIVQG